MSLVVIDSTKTFEKTVADNKGKLVVVDFYADWCGPCKVLAPKYEQFAKDNTDVVFCKCNVEDADDFSGELGIKSLPSIFFFKDGECVQKVIGMRLDEIKQAISDHS